MTRRSTTTSTDVVAGGEASVVLRSSRSWARLSGTPLLLVVPFIGAGVVIAAAPPSGSLQQPQAAAVEGGAPKPRPAPLLPDMVALRAQNMSIQIVSRHRLLRFAAGLGNIGSGPMEVRSNNARRCPPRERHASQIVYRDVDGNSHFRRAVDTDVSRQSAGCMIFHPEHDHWHFEAAARYVLYRPSEADHVVVRARKTSFCLRDSERVPPHRGTFHTRPYYGDCSRDTPQGITPGWVDVYEAFLSGQSLRLPNRLRNGVYCLGIRVDPRNRLWEGDEANNLSTRAIHLRGVHVSPAHTHACAPGQRS